ncbi:MAG: NUDIX hydrolase [Chitinophagaceae bacterium]|nr:NUDIX hydrolase [Chitinophagaceae bacterium]
MVENKNPWIVKGEKAIYDNAWINVTEYDVINPSGGKGIYGKVHFKNTAIGVIALDEEQNIWLVGQYRFVLNEYSWEIPEGGCPEGEDYLTAAKRELLEETGLVAQSWRQLMKLHLSNSVTDELAFVFLATQLDQKTASPEDTEELMVKKMPFEEAVKMVEQGEITDAISVAAIQRVQLLLLSNTL